jgi:hypothetical protein
LFNTTITVAFWLNLRSNLNDKFNGVNEKFGSINQRFDDMRDLWRAELRRVEAVLDARLKHLEAGRR